VRQVVKRTIIQAFLYKSHLYKPRLYKLICIARYTNSGREASDAIYKTHNWSCTKEMSHWGPKFLLSPPASGLALTRSGTGRTTKTIRPLSPFIQLQASCCPPILRADIGSMLNCRLPALANSPVRFTGLDSPAGVSELLKGHTVQRRRRRKGAVAPSLLAAPIPSRYRARSNSAKTPHI
jgi:hypothetical protein